MKCKKILGIIVLLVTQASSISLAFDENQDFAPRAKTEAMIVQGEARFTILTPQVIRMEWSENRQFEDRASLVFITRDLEVPDYKTFDEGNWLIISTDKLIMRYKKGSGKFNNDNLRMVLTVSGEEVIWHPGLPDRGNLKGTARTLDGYDGEFTWDGKRIALEPGVVSMDGWVLIDDTDSLLFDSSDQPWVMQRPEGGRQDWYFFGHGHDYKQALLDYTKIAGKIPMPPRFAFGYWWSRYWTYSDTELKKLVRDFKNYDIPIDVLIIDMDWHNTFGFRANEITRDPFGQVVGWTGYTWNRELFPEPEIFLRWTEEHNLKTALNLHPASGIPPMEERYEEFAEAIGFDTAEKDYIPYAMADKKFARAYFNVLLGPLVKLGIDFWWLDWQQFPTSKVVGGLNNTWWLNYTFFTEMQRKGKRPLIFHRWGGLGNHRYPIGFSGDSKTTWKSLAFQPYFTATAANVGYGYWSHDIGGHNPGRVATDPELYLRWLQYGVFSPIMRTHSSKLSTTERRFWRFPDHFDLMKKTTHLRYALFPYIYAAARQAYDTGVSVCRPMYYDYPEEREAYSFKGQYMFGNDMLVAPIVSGIARNDMLATVKIWLPKGEWYELFTGSMLVGGKVVERKFSLAEIPVYVKAGSVIPMFPKVSNLQQLVNTLVLTLIPGGDSEITIYEDDGITENYQKNEFGFTRIKRESLSAGVIKLTVFPREGEYANMPAKRAYEIRLPGSFPPSEVKVNGEEYSYDYKGSKGCWTYRGAQLETIIRTPLFPCDQQVEVEVQYPNEYKGQENMLSGKIGIFRRLSTVVNLLKYEVARTDWGATLPDMIIGAVQTPVKIDYHPRNTLQELIKFDRNFEMMIEMIMQIPDADKDVLSKCANHLK